MRSWGRPSSPTAHIAFCTLIEVLRPQILIMLPPAHPWASARPADLTRDAWQETRRRPRPQGPGASRSGLLRLAPGPRLFLQHDRNSVADRIGEAGCFRDQLLFLGVVSERDFLAGADQQL